MDNPHRWRTLLVAAIGYGAVQMGMMPVIVIMPTLSLALGEPLRVTNWVLTGYLLAMTALVLPAGRLGDRYGHQRLFLSGIAVHTLAAGMIGMVSSFWPLLILRLVQGGGSAFIVGTAMAWATNAFPAIYRGRVVGTVTLFAFIGSLTSIGLSTSLLSSAGWQMVFLILVPPGLVALLVGITIPNVAAPRSGPRLPLDWWGAALLGATLTVFSLGIAHLHEGGESWIDGWDWHLPLNLLSLGLAVLFVWVQKRARDPIFPLHYCRNYALVAAVGANMSLHVVMLAWSVMLPFLIQTGMGLTPKHTAVAVLMFQAVSLLVSPISGWLYDKSNSKILLPGSMALMSSGLFMYGLWTTSFTYGQLLALGAWMGVGIGLFLTANNAALMGSVPKVHRGFASGLLEVTRQLGHSLASTAVGTILSYGISQANTAEGQIALQHAFRTSYWILAAIGLAGVGCTIWHIRERDKLAVGRAADIPISPYGSHGPAHSD